MKGNLEQFMLKHGLSGASIARSLGVSTGLVSLVKNGKLDKISAEVLQKFDDFIANYRTKRIEKNQEIVATSDFNMVQFIVEETIVNSEMGAVFGKAGTGKTVAIKDYCEKHPEAVLVETIPMMSVKELLLDILEGQGIKNAVGSQKELFNMIVANFKSSERVLIIDEAENLTTKSLEAIRRIHDFSQVPTVLVGTYALMINLKGRQGELLQLYSRISNKWEMKGLNEADRTTLFGDLGKVIARFTADIRRSMSIYRKAKRYSQMGNETLNVNHIQMATQSVILD
ncbi:MAG: AAA family ATPase [Mariprofundus sp.]|nr:AAA family ATPase [Mariprofundus sp.]